MCAEYYNTEQHDTLVSISNGRYQDMRMCWTGRPELPRAYAITDVSRMIVEVSEDLVWLAIQNDDSINPVWLNFGGGNVAVASSCMRIDPGAMLILDRSTPWRQTIQAICAAGKTAILMVNLVTQSDIRSGRGA
jgi:hypothetical protein